MQEKSRRTCNDVFEMPAMLPTTLAKLLGRGAGGSERQIAFTVIPRFGTATANQFIIFYAREI